MPDSSRNDGTDAVMRGTALSFIVFLFSLLSIMSIDRPHLSVAQDFSRTDKELVVVVVRHAEKFCGYGDVDLHDDGKQRAEALATALSRAHVTAIVTSTLRRAIQTAEPLINRLRPEEESKPTDIRSKQCGELNGLTTERLHRCPQRNRINDEVLRQQAGTVLVVGHSNTVPDIIAELNGPHLDQFPGWRYGKSIPLWVYSSLFTLYPHRMKRKNGDIPVEFRPYGKSDQKDKGECRF